uniref:Uncharacterized protein n=1 Tax=Ditylenchus dipsaci TaxID=166011 RepID=A0A915DWF3_9BILA
MCKPLFFNGNAFQVKTEMRYDRIYCGALVPHSRRSYFCNFLKIGGILVVPYGHLLQRIVRQSETQFVVYDVSSVVFSQLVFPNQENAFTMRQLEIPLLKAPRLTDICRNKIRHCVREAITSSEIYPLQMLISA